MGAGAEPAGVAFAAAEAVGARGPIFKNSRGFVDSSSRLPLPLSCRADTPIKSEVITKRSALRKFIMFQGRVPSPQSDWKLFVSSLSQIECM